MREEVTSDQAQAQGLRSDRRQAGDGKALRRLVVPAGTIHSVKNIGSDNGAELATYVVEK